MGDSSKFVLMLFPQGLQGTVWQVGLRSQQLSVIWESADVNLVDSINSLKMTGATLPDLLLIDTRLQALQPYKICRWSQLYAPEIKVLLVNGAQLEVTEAERQWAIYQGAVDLLPQLDRYRVISMAVKNVKRALELIEGPKLDCKALVSVLLKLSHVRSLR
ncbi:MAG: hypothetical protein QNJ46_07890 [Leptolyngbyaceae cyanobacterium MO_188.B28]|nr:hypothetical protein [Leptolyngbyaceae cyanobacterium MO_188.B28]